MGANRTGSAGRTLGFMNSWFHPTNTLLMNTGLSRGSLEKVIKKEKWTREKKMYVTIVLGSSFFKKDVISFCVSFVKPVIRFIILKMEPFLIQWFKKNLCLVFSNNINPSCKQELNSFQQLERTIKTDNLMFLFMKLRIILKSYRYSTGAVPCQKNDTGKISSQLHLYQ